MRAVAEILEAQHIDTVCLYGTSLRYSHPLARLAKRLGLITVASVNEWGHRGAQDHASYFMQRLGIHYVARRFDKVIAISDLMVTFFSRFPRLRIARIPSVFDLADLQLTDPGQWRREDSRDHILLAYAGAIGSGKDAISNVIRALAQIDETEREHFRFVLAGSDEAAVRASLGDEADEVMAKTEHLLEFKGFLPRADVRALVMSADYTVLLRANEPFANAGFPTKFAENSCSACRRANLTSDIGHYLHDGIEGHVVIDESPEAMAAALRRVLAVHHYPNTPMRAAAARTGQNCIRRTHLRARDGRAARDQNRVQIVFTRRRLQFAGLAGANFLAMLVNFATAITLTHIMTRDDFGSFRYALTFLTTVAVVVEGSAFLMAPAFT